MSTWTLGCPLSSGNGFAFDACTWAVDAYHHKNIKEVAYVNYNGASLFSAVSLMLIYPVAICFQMVASSCAKRYCSTYIALALEYATAIVPLTCSFSAPHFFGGFVAVIVALGVAAALRGGIPLTWPRLVARMATVKAVRSADDKSQAFSKLQTGGRLRFVAEYRAMVMFTTCIGILAVDFPSIFPREHAKTEETGYSLMDLGTGCIICTSAICSRYARSVTGRREPLSILKQICALWPVLVIGFARLFVLRGIDYHVPTSEYGVHWNFFFTVAAISIFASIAAFGPRMSIFAGATLLIVYQVYLSAFGGAEYMFRAPRVDLLSANREGILSCAGYLGIYWLAVGLGSLTLSSSLGGHAVAVGLFAVAGFGIGVAAFCDFGLGLPASRRLCNLPYAALILGTNALVLGLLAAVDLGWPVFPRLPMPVAYLAISDSMLTVFLAANLLTGLVNTISQPLFVPPAPAILCMLVYSFAWCVPFGVLRSRGVMLKFW
eukprot:TRINITY_DN42054_c0_g1_i1.p1 TRINITY_DN42054_c0_g1~~TRINITY_DN42054_c0_g1_i1.p1  ORF type:complete len:518 (-),score=31.18 TRINITY_DN42054_c0_g1_i1:262-1737(-)